MLVGRCGGLRLLVLSCPVTIPIPPHARGFCPPRAQQLSSSPLLGLRQLAVYYRCCAIFAGCVSYTTYSSTI
jgi:hypothetical protein